MLGNAPATTMLPVIDLDRARRFYEGRLGLRPLGSSPDGKFKYECGGATLALFPKPEGTRAEHTAEHVCVLGSEKAAWLKDTEGNYLCIHEDLA